MDKQPEKDPELELALQKQQNEKSRLPVYKALLLACVMAGAATFMGLADKSRQGDTMPAVAPGIATDGDHVTMEQRVSIDALFSVYTGRLAALDPVRQKQAFMDSPYLAADVKAQLWAEMESGDRRLAAVTLWDNFDEDGDVVTIASEGVIVSVPLSHTPVTLYLPYRPGGSLTITGTRDGGGGITAAIETQAGGVPLPIMGVGQSITLPLL